ncbi:MAG: hypothetical protein IJ282_08830 [Lachnospiraceae bacterium]|nr:hypothetical protein [Lachnospiraceae bacterium]
MKLKYYMRGLGIGMVVTAFILSIALGGDKQTMTDEEVKTRARELGMVESAVLSQIAQQNQETNKPQPETPETVVDETEVTGTEKTEEETKTPETEMPETETPETQTTETETPETETPETQTGETKTPETEESGNETVITIVINRGESSVSVSRSLERAGLVEDAGDYDRFLCNNGYDKTIAVGTYEIPVGATKEEIAKIITKRR